MPHLGLQPSFFNGYATNASESERPELWDGLVGAYYPCFGYQGANVFDLSGQNNIAPIVGAHSWGNGFVSLLKTAIIDIPEILIALEGTVIVKARMQKIDTDAQWLFGSNTSNRIYMYLNTASFDLIARKGSSGNFGGTTLSVGQVFTAALSWDSNGQNTDFYVDNTLSGSMNNTNTNPPQSISVGSFNEGSSKWEGDVYSCLIYQKKLSADKIKNISNDPSALFRLASNFSGFASGGGGGPTFNPAWAIDASKVGGYSFA